LHQLPAELYGGDVRERPDRRWISPDRQRASISDLMTSLEAYPTLKLVHVSLVTASGFLFAVRGTAALARYSWTMHKYLRWVSYGIDTLLLAAGAALWLLLNLNPMRDSWLGTKLLLLVVYIVLGSLALKRGRTPTVRWVSFAAAVSLYLFIASVAIRHDPLGLLAR